MNAMPSNAKPCKELQKQFQCNAMSSNATQCRAMPSNAKQSNVDEIVPLHPTTYPLTEAVRRTIRMRNDEAPAW